MRSLSTKTVVFVSTTLTATLAHSQSTPELLAGVHPFLCGSDPVILAESDGSWQLLGQPTINVSKTATGWRYDVPRGTVAFLQREGSDWTIQALGSDGYQTSDCQDLSEVTAVVVEKIRPLLEDKIDETTVQLDETTARLDETTVQLDETTVQLDETTAQLDETTAQLDETLITLEETKAALDVVLSSSISSDAIAAERIKRLCIYMKTYNPSVVSGLSFRMDGQEFKLCE